VLHLLWSARAVPALVSAPATPMAATAAQAPSEPRKPRRDTLDASFSAVGLSAQTCLPPLGKKPKLRQLNLVSKIHLGTPASENPFPEHSAIGNKKKAVLKRRTTSTVCSALPDRKLQRYNSKREADRDRLP
jgi:hypothetical protein